MTARDDVDGGGVARDPFADVRAGFEKLIRWASSEEALRMPLCEVEARLAVDGAVFLQGLKDAAAQLEIGTEGRQGPAQDRDDREGER